MKKSWMFSLAAMLLVFLLPGCGDEKETNPIVPICDESWDQFPPIAEGNYWLFRRVEWETGEPDYEYDYTTTVQSVETVLDGCTAYVLYDDDDQEEVWFVQVGCQLRIYEEHPDEADDYVVLLENPPVQGRTWLYSPEPVMGERLYAVIVSADETKTVPAGEFEHCIHVHVAPYFNMWFSLEVGIVAMENAGSQGTYGVTDELVRYQIGPPILGRAGYPDSRRTGLEPLEEKPEDQASPAGEVTNATVEAVS